MNSPVHQPRYPAVIYNGVALPAMSRFVVVSSLHLYIKTWVFLHACSALPAHWPMPGTFWQLRDHQHAPEWYVNKPL